MASTPVTDEAHHSSQREPQSTGGFPSHASAGSTVIYIVAAEPTGERAVPLRAGRNSVGRSSSADATLEEPTVSGRHCDVWCSCGDNPVAFVEDKGSRNGTFMCRGQEEAPAHCDLLDPGRMWQILPGNRLWLGALQCVLSPDGSDPVGAAFPETQHLPEEEAEDEAERPCSVAHPCPETRDAEVQVPERKRKRGRDGSQSQQGPREGQGGSDARVHVSSRMDARRKARLEAQVRGLGGEAVGPEGGFTHLVVPSKGEEGGAKGVGRTRATLEALALGKPIAAASWLEDSRKAGRFVEVDPKRHAPADKGFERRFSARLRDRAAGGLPGGRDALQGKRFSLSLLAPTERELLGSFLPAVGAEVVDGEQGRPSSGGVFVLAEPNSGKQGYDKELVLTAAAIHHTFNPEAYRLPQ